MSLIILKLKAQKLTIKKLHAGRPVGCISAHCQIPSDFSSSLVTGRLIFPCPTFSCEAKNELSVRWTRLKMLPKADLLTSSVKLSGWKLQNIDYFRENTNFSVFGFDSWPGVLQQLIDRSRWTQFQRSQRETFSERSIRSFVSSGLEVGLMAFLTMFNSKKIYD